MTDPRTIDQFSSDAELHTIIAALRFWQQHGQGDPLNRTDEMHDLATNGGELCSSLDDEGIDDLVMKLNLGTVTLLCESTNTQVAE